MSANNLQKFVQDDGRTLRNRLGIWRDPDALEAKLSFFSGERIQDLRENPDLIPRTYDEAHLRALHAHILGDVFEWAGKTRNETVTIEGERIGPVDTMAKPGGAQFDRAKDLPRGFKTLEAMTDVEAAKAMDRKSFAAHAARIFTHINWMHPFREGNGRVQREFLAAYAEDAGHSLDFSVLTQARLYDVSARSTRDHQSSMRRMMEEISDPDAVRRLRLAQDKLGRHPQFQSFYFSHTRPGHAVTGQLLGFGQEEFVIQDGADMTVGRTRDLPEGCKRNDMVTVTQPMPPAPAADRPQKRGAPSLQ